MATTNAFLEYLVTLANELITLIPWIRARVDEVNASKQAAADSASAAAGSVTTAGGHASAASGSAGAAADSASDAAADRQLAGQYLAAFQSDFLGPHADDAAVNAWAAGEAITLEDGVFYYKNTAPKGLRIRDGGAWSAAVLDANGALMAANGLSDLPDPAAARVNVGAADRAWQDKAGAYTASAGDRIKADTGAAAFTITLPASRPDGAEVWFMDPGANWATNNLTVSGNGANIAGAATFTADLDGGYFIAIFDATADEWQVRMYGGAV
ncbi:hypothetical protein [Sulfitobacter dubius]|uniref:hypothetical protein n=1 Tax=Sulfitobacter dubius TaxID=218673 RepID=UPI0030DAD0B1